MAFSERNKVKTGTKSPRAWVEENFVKAARLSALLAGAGLCSIAVSVQARAPSGSLADCLSRGGTGDNIIVTAHPQPSAPSVARLPTELSSEIIQERELLSCAEIGTGHS